MKVLFIFNRRTGPVAFFPITAIDYSSQWTSKALTIEFPIMNVPEKTVQQLIAVNTIPADQLVTFSSLKAD